MQTDPKHSPSATRARNELSPLLSALIKCLEAEGAATARAHFLRIDRSLNAANDEWDLRGPIINLTSCKAMGFKFSKQTNPLVERILEKSTLLVEEMEGQTPKSH